MKVMKPAVVAVATAIAAVSVAPQAGAYYNGGTSQPWGNWFEQAQRTGIKCAIASGVPTGPTVEGAQAMLWASGAYGTPSSSNKNVVDGNFGSATATAVKNFQKNFSFIQSDGCIGPNTWNTMRALLQPTGGDSIYSNYRYVWPAYASQGIGIDLESSQIAWCVSWGGGMHAMVSWLPWSTGCYFY